MKYLSPLTAWFASVGIQLKALSIGANILPLSYVSRLRSCHFMQAHFSVLGPSPLLLEGIGKALPGTVLTCIGSSWCPYMAPGPWELSQKH